MTLQFCFLFTILCAMVTTAFGDARCPGDLSPLRYHALPHSHMAVPVKLSVHREMDIAFAVPANGGRLCPNRAEDGVLPTTLFKRVFISAADQFVMFDPR